MPATPPMPAWKAGRLTKESAASKAIYNWFIRRNSSYVTTIFAFAVVGGIAFDKAMDAVWAANNKGKFWPDIKDKFAGDDE